MRVRAGATSFGTAGIGQAAAGFLKLGVDARAEAMGEAFSAVADDAGAMYWNPAALTNIEKRSATVMHAVYLASSYFDYAAYGQKVGDAGACGAALQYFSAGAIRQTGPAGTGEGDFTPYDLAASVGCAYRLAPGGTLAGYSFGIAGKYVRSQILQSAQTLAADIGALSPAYLDGRLRFAFTAANLGGKLRFEREAESLPLVFKAGSSYKLSSRWLVSLDAGFPSDGSAFVGVGTEIVAAASSSVDFAARAGFNSTTIGDVSGFTGASFGFGLASRGGSSIDYAIVPFGGLGQAHRVSMSCKF